MDGADSRPRKWLQPQPGILPDFWVDHICTPDAVEKALVNRTNHGLMLVDWCAGQRLRAHEAGFVE